MNTKQHVDKTGFFTTPGPRCEASLERSKHPTVAASDVCHVGGHLHGISNRVVVNVVLLSSRLGQSCSLGATVRLIRGQAWKGGHAK